MHGLVRLGCLLVLALTAARPVSTWANTPEPRNLSTLKDEIRTYVSSGEYDRAVAEVAKQAEQWIESRARMEPRQTADGAAQPHRLALVMDLDDTLFRNAPTILAHDFGYDRAGWDAWVESASAPALEPVREIYRTARRLGVDVIFLTARRERERAASERNLRAIGCGEYTRLVCRANDSKLESGVFKCEERRRLIAEGYSIIANVGDQLSDFAGGCSEREFKIPNPFYLTP